MVAELSREGGIESVTKAAFAMSVLPADTGEGIESAVESSRSVTTSNVDGAAVFMALPADTGEGIDSAVELTTSTVDVFMASALVFSDAVFLGSDLRGNLEDWAPFGVPFLESEDWAPFRVPFLESEDWAPFFEFAGTHLGMDDGRAPAACVCDVGVAGFGFCSFAVLVRSFVWVVRKEIGTLEDSFFSAAEGFSPGFAPVTSAFLGDLVETVGSELDSRASVPIRDSLDSVIRITTMLDANICHLWDLRCFGD